MSYCFPAFRDAHKADVSTVTGRALAFIRRIHLVERRKKARSMFQLETTVPSVKGISRPVQASFYLKFIVSRVLEGKHTLVPQSLMQTKPLPIAIWLHTLKRREVLYG